MAEFGKTSKRRLAECHNSLQILFNKVVEGYDCTVLCGKRGEDEQNKAYSDKRSKLKFPESKHNKTPSLAIDIAPYPIDWNDLGRFYFFAGYVIGIASQMGIKIRWGGDWDRDMSIRDQYFNDLPHFEMVLED